LDAHRANECRETPAECPCATRGCTATVCGNHNDSDNPIQQQPLLMRMIDGGGGGGGGGDDDD
jgi:hypothetical protein